MLLFSLENQQFQMRGKDKEGRYMEKVRDATKPNLKTMSKCTVYGYNTKPPFSFPPYPMFNIIDVLKDSKGCSIGYAILICPNKNTT